ncbi:hypothetical protein GJV26_02365 [Massilia dura]|uniref:Uncharacterized protein n=1 Tax=Pseudoduganella dura TaxID=321982 RepID=A0A6I3X6D4_9BURK|nr:hypothetical protein [Pseudoduganella dura]MUI11336.1 hypothetical protein [Pseudoduganella dura]GGX95479.1 hypothetical protein GCM10007386_27960 [Pseudoduganella dura]
MSGLAYVLDFTASTTACVAVGLLVSAAAWLLRDGLRLVTHLRAADRLIAAGIPERDALRQAGCLFWQTPWYRRIFRRYPRLRA